jgi:hypothetical protein
MKKKHKPPKDGFYVYKLYEDNFEEGPIFGEKK